MMNKSKREVREMLIKQASRTTPDLWDKIEPQLKSNPEPKVARGEKSSRKPIYRYAVAVFAILLAGAVAIVSIRNPKTIVNMLSSTASFSSANPSASSSASSHPSSVLFSSLHFPASSNQLTLSEDPSATMCLAPFSEKDVITHSEIICKATVTNSYVKDYKYDINCDKSEENGWLHQAEAIVYEIKIDDLYYNNKNIKVGDTIKIEENTWIGTTINGLAFVLQKNHQYILNLYDFDSKVSGNSKRDGRYALCYPFAPQIEVTLDRQYVFHDGWKSLLNNKTIPIVWDMSNSSGVTIEYYADKMKLRQDKDFISDYKKMIAKYK